MNTRAVCLGVITYVALYALHSLLLASVYSTLGSSTSSTVTFLFEYGFWFLLVIPGFVAALVAKSRGILHGTVVGLIVGGLYFIVALLLREPGESLTTFAVFRATALTTALGAIGGSLVHIRKLRALGSNNALERTRGR